jgi:hypothetical protein
MQTAQIDHTFEFPSEFGSRSQDSRPQEQTFSSVWGNEMQREDFLALATGLRHYNASLAIAGYENGRSTDAPEQPLGQ